MLRAIRNGSQGILVRGLLVVIIAGFALWGVQGVGGSTPSPIALIGDETVPQSQFLMQFQNEVNARRNQSDGEYTFQQAYDEGLDDLILERLMYAKAFDNASEALGLYASDKRVAAALRDIPIFTDVMGNFDRVSYEEEINRLGLTTKSFQQNRRDDAERGDMLRAFMGGAPAPAALVDLVFKANLEERNVEFFELSNKNIDVAAPSTIDTRAYYDAHPETFTSEEMRKLSYVTIQISDVIATIEVDEERIAELYEDRRDTYVIAEKRDVQHLLVTDEDAATALHARLVGGLDFIAAATETGQLAAEVNLGSVSQEDIAYLGADAAEAAFVLSAGGISAPVESDLGGWVIFKATTIVPAIVSSLDDVREQLRTDLAIEDAQIKIVEMSEQAQDSLSEDMTIAEIAEDLGLRVRVINSLSPSGYDQFGTIVQGLPNSRNFFESAFAKEAGEFDEVEETEGGSYFIVHVDAITPPALKSYDEVKRRASSLLTVERRSEAAANRANSLLEQSIAAGALGGAAENAKTNVQLGNGLRRGGQSVPQAFSRLVLERVFQAENDGIVMAPNRDGDGYVVAQVVAISDTSAEAGGEVYAQLQDNVQNLFANDLVTLYHSYLSEEYPAEINHGVRTQLQEQLVE
jgi:peptidyl-prolyl cis-trans isomerase D